jgi:hypothetical protein
LSFQSETDWWKRISILAPIIAAIISGIAAYFAADGRSVQPRLSFGGAALHLTVEPDVMPSPVVKVNGELRKPPVDYSVVSETKVIVDVGEAIKLSNAYKSHCQKQQQLLTSSIAPKIEFSLQAVKQMNELTARSMNPDAAKLLETGHFLNELLNSAKTEIIPFKGPAEPCDFLRE